MGYRKETKGKGGGGCQECRVREAEDLGSPCPLPIYGWQEKEGDGEIECWSPRHGIGIYIGNIHR